MALGKDVVTAFAAVLSAVAVLAVEPLAGRLWYHAEPAPGPARRITGARARSDASVNRPSRSGAALG